MSNALAIATVTATLARAVRSAAEKAVGGADVVIGRPEAPAGGRSRKVHVYLYQVTPNVAHRNMDLPGRDSAGRLTQRPRVGLDLHYLFAFYGNDTELEPQRMLGAVVRDLHVRPILSRQSIRDVVAGEPTLANSDLAEAFDLVRVTPVPLNLEELSKLWSVFVQTPHAVSVAYQASTVSIEGEDVVQSPPPPVLQRGTDDRGIETLLGPFPTLESIHIGTPEDGTLRPRPPSYPAAKLGSVLFLRGRHLGGGPASLRFTHARLDAGCELPVSANRAPEPELTVSLPDDASAQSEWAAGIYTVTVVMGRPGGRRLASNALPLALAPRILSVEPQNPTRDGDGNVTLAITCSPRARVEQRVVLLLGGREIPVQPRYTASDPLRFLVEDAPVGADLLPHLQVDGAESLPLRRVGVPPRFVFDDSQRVRIA